MSTYTNVKPIKVYGQGGPNPPKVAILVAELGLPHEIIPVSFPDLKKPEYLKININGRMPSLQDPNTDITLWESGALIEYIIDKYDKEHKFSFPADTNEYYLCKQWLFFQVSGQGPYFGQAAWFKKFHHEQLPSAIERYSKEVNRVTGVLETQLSQQKEKYPDGDGPWLVGNKKTYADISFIMWHIVIQAIIDKEAFDEDDYPNVKQWITKMRESEPTKKVLEVAMAGH